LLLNSQEILQYKLKIKVRKIENFDLARLKLHKKANIMTTFSLNGKFPDERSLNQIKKGPKTTTLELSNKNIYFFKRLFHSFERYTS